MERDNAREIEVSFLSGSARVDFNAELEDNEVRIRVRDRRTESRSSTSTPGSDDGAAVRTVQGNGGLVTVRHIGSTVMLVAAAPTAGYATDVRSSGSDKVEVRFTSGDRETRIEIESKDGQLRERVENR